MKTPNLRLCILIVVVATITCGCGRTSIEQYVPETDLAREALKTVLDGWQANDSSEKTFTIANGPTVHVLDQDWRAGRKLSKFEILNELPSEPAEPKRFTVKLIYSDQGAQEIVYHVVGKDPLWVFRQEDYSKTSGM